MTSQRLRLWLFASTLAVLPSCSLAFDGSGYLPAGAGTCNFDNCVGATGYCDSSGMCVPGCDEDRDCPGSTCRSADRTCNPIACTTDEMCPGTQICTGGTCVEPCVEDADCNGPGMGLANFCDADGECEPCDLDGDGWAVDAPEAAGCEMRPGILGLGDCDDDLDGGETIHPFAYPDCDTGTDETCGVDAGTIDLDTFEVGYLPLVTVPAAAARNVHVFPVGATADESDVVLVYQTATGPEVRYVALADGASDIRPVTLPDFTLGGVPDQTQLTAFSYGDRTQVHLTTFDHTAAGTVRRYGALVTGDTVTPSAVSGMYSFEGPASGRLEAASTVATMSGVRGGVLRTSPNSMWVANTADEMTFPEITDGSLTYTSGRGYSGVGVGAWLLPNALQLWNGMAASGARFARVTFTGSSTARAAFASTGGTSSDIGMLVVRPASPGMLAVGYSECMFGTGGVIEIEACAPTLFDTAIATVLPAEPLITADSIGNGTYVFGALTTEGVALGVVQAIGTSAATVAGIVEVPNDMLGAATDLDIGVRPDGSPTRIDIAFAGAGPAGVRVGGLRICSNR